MSYQGKEVKKLGTLHNKFESNSINYKAETKKSNSDTRKNFPKKTSRVKIKYRKFINFSRTFDNLFSKQFYPQKNISNCLFNIKNAN